MTRRTGLESTRNSWTPNCTTGPNLGFCFIKTFQSSTYVTLTIMSIRKNKFSQISKKKKMKKAGVKVSWLCKNINSATIFSQKDIADINVYVYIRNQCFFMIPDTDITPAESNIRTTKNSYIHLCRSRKKVTFWDVFVTRMRNLEHSAAVL